MRASKLFLIGIFILLMMSLVSASRLPTIGGDENDWGTVLNDFLSKIAGSDGVKLNETMVNGTNIYSSSINTSHILDGTLSAEDLADDSINSSKIDLTEVTISKFTNDANYLDKDEGGTIDGNVIINGNLSLIGSYLNATVTNQYLNGSFLPEINNLFNLGSSLLKWANLYVTNIYASKVYSDDWSNVTIEESQISDLQSYLTSESDPIYSAWDKDYNDLTNKPEIPTIWDEIFNNTGDSRWGGGIDTQKTADGNYLYNDTTTIYFNETKLNNTIDNIADNYNETDLINSVNSSLSTRIDGISGGNSSFNQSLTDTLYAPVNYGDDWNKTYADTLYASISVTGDNSSWNQSLADTLYAGIEWDYNQSTPVFDYITSQEASWLSTYNATYDTWAYNQTIPANAYADTQDVIFNDSMKDYVDNQISGVAGDNSSWNESYARTIFYDEESDLTTLLDDNYAPVNYGDDWNKTYADTLYASISVTGDNSSWNQSLADTLYMDINQDDWIDDGEESDLNVNSSDYWDNLGTINETQMENNDGTLSILVSWLTSLFYTESEVDIALGNQDECSEITGCVENAITTSDADTAFVNATGDTMTGNLNVTGNITTTDTFCFNSDCSAKMYHNGSGIIISS